MSFFLFFWLISNMVICFFETHFIIDRLLMTWWQVNNLRLTKTCSCTSFHTCLRHTNYYYVIIGTWEKSENRLMTVTAKKIHLLVLSREKIFLITKNTHAILINCETNNNCYICIKKKEYEIQYNEKSSECICGIIKENCILI